MSAATFMVAADHVVIMENMTRCTGLHVCVLLHLQHALPNCTWGHARVSTKVNVILFSSDWDFFNLFLRVVFFISS